ncbi:MAG: hypothetical protein ACTSWZ_00755 [Candidatus Heimdallarchaeaceae archaeon]
MVKTYPDVDFVKKKVFDFLLSLKVRSVCVEQQKGKTFILKVVV